MRKLFIIAALILITACSNDIPRSKVIFISVAASYGIEGEVNYLANPPGDQRALSEQMAYMTERRGLPYTEHIFLERDGRMSASGEEKDWGRHDILDLLGTLEAGPDDFRAMVSDTELIEPLKGRTKVYSSTYLSDNWGTNDAFLNYRRWAADEFVLGVGNHDPQPLRQLASDIPDIVIENGVKKENFYKRQQIEPLSRILKIPKELLSNPVEFAKAKFAEAFTAKNNMLFYMDVFGREERFDMQDFNNPMAYSHKIPVDFEKAYINSLKEGFGFNPMDALAKIFLSKGLDKTHPDLYNRIVKYRDILVEEDKVVVSLKQSPKGLNKKLLIIASTALALCVGVFSCFNAKRVDKNKSKDFNSKDIQQNTQKIQLPTIYEKFKI